MLTFSDACWLPPAASATPPEHLELVPAPLELLPEPLDLHAYLWNTSGPKWMVKIHYVTKTHPRSSSCLANPVTEPLVSSEEALLTRNTSGAKWMVKKNPPRRCTCSEHDPHEVCCHRSRNYYGVLCTCVWATCGSQCMVQDYMSSYDWTYILELLVKAVVCLQCAHAVLCKYLSISCL